MSKAHRGKGIWELAARGRGTCPVCKRENIKVLYEQEAEGQKVKICKTCKAALKHGKKTLSITAAAPAKAPAETASEPATAPAETAAAATPPDPAA